MINKVFTNFRDPVESYPTGEKLVGINHPGRFAGFDVFTGSGLNVALSHFGRIKKASKTVGGTITEKSFGALLMPCGSVVHSESTNVNDTIPFVITDNGANANDRYDLVVCEHEFLEVTGGQAPIFFIQVGPLNGTVPLLANPKKQVIIGVIKINAGGGNFAAMTYTKAPTPLNGDAAANEVFAQLGIPAALLLKEDLDDADAVRTRLTAIESNQTVIAGMLSVLVADGGVLIWGKAANLIPAGWSEWTPMKGKTPFGLDSTITEFNSILKAGGNKDHTNTIAEMVQHTHGIKTLRISIDHDGSGEDYLHGGANEVKYQTEVATGATGAAYSILNPYRVVMFIHWTGGSIVV